MAVVLGRSEHRVGARLFGLGAQKLFDLAQLFDRAGVAVGVCDEWLHDGHRDLPDLTEHVVLVHRAQCVTGHLQVGASLLKDFGTRDEVDTTALHHVAGIHAGTAKLAVHDVNPCVTDDGHV